MTDTPVRKTITVNASAQRAFEVFTTEMDSWWLRSHHIGKTPLKRTVVEPRLGGRLYSEHEDGAECPWGQVLAWEPPHRFVMAWQITPEWQYQPDLAQSSEVEVTFTPEGNGQTRVDLEHRHFARHGAGGDNMRQGVGSEGGWTALLAAFAKEAESKLVA